MHNNTDIRLQAIYDIGVKVDDSLEAARLETSKREGAYEAYSNIATSFSEMFEQAESSYLGENTVFLKEWSLKILDVCRNMVEYSGAQVHTARGAENQAKMTVEMIKRVYDAESEKKVKVPNIEHLQDLARIQERAPRPITPVEKPEPAPSPSTSQLRARTIKEQRQRSSPGTGT
jgi:hypothetical protein